MYPSKVIHFALPASLAAVVVVVGVVRSKLAVLSSGYICFGILLATHIKLYRGYCTNSSDCKFLQRGLAALYEREPRWLFAIPLRIMLKMWTQWLVLQLYLFS
jgi:hypothetical protein